MHFLNHGPRPSLWKNCLSRNRSLVSKRLGTADSKAGGDPVHCRRGQDESKSGGYWSSPSSSPLPPPMNATLSAIRVSWPGCSLLCPCLALQSQKSALAWPGVYVSLADTTWGGALSSDYSFHTAYASPGTPRGPLMWLLRTQTPLPAPTLV